MSPKTTVYNFIHLFQMFPLVRLLLVFEVFFLSHFVKHFVACMGTILPQCLSNTLKLRLSYLVRYGIKLTKWF